MKLEFELRGGGGEPLDLLRTFASHGVAELPPFWLDDATPSLTVTLALGRSARTVTVAPGSRGRGIVTVAGPSPTVAMQRELLREVRRVLRIDEDLSAFYEQARRDPAMVWACAGAGRMIRSQTVFEEVVKTVCTTNCTWSATVRMVTALVEHLGERAPGTPAAGPFGRAFPTPEVVAEAGESFFRDVARAGYRGAYLAQLARSVATGELDLERYATASPEGLPDGQLEAELLALPGVGPYAAAHIMMTLGRYHRLILDSWSRPTYAKLVGKRAVKDAAIERRFRRYGPYAGLAFWLLITRDWVTEPGASA